MAPKGFVIGGQSHAAPALAPGLYLVATPVGNLGDISIRALQTLAGADLVLCEDTRASAVLLAHYGISTPRRAFHQHNEAAAAAAVLDAVAGGSPVALISDAGTPLLSDPGFPLVRAARERGVAVFAVPGASALLAAIGSAGLPADRFSFLGFLPVRSAARRKTLELLADRPETLVFYESPRRLGPALADMASVFGGAREAAVARELTKKFETVYRGTLGELAARFAGEAVRGEVVVLVGGAPVEAADPRAWKAALSAALASQPLKSAVDDIAAAFAVSRREVYQAALAIRDAGDG